MLPGPMEMVVIGVIGVLLFGSRLPKIARSIGESIPSFRRGLRDIEDDIDPTKPIRGEK